MAKGRAMKKSLKLPGNGFEIFYYEMGAGEPLVYVHGIGEVPESPPFLQELSQKYRVIVPLYLSPSTNQAIAAVSSVLDWVLFCNDFLDALKIQECTLLGHSLGGMLAAELAAVTPERVKKLILVNSLGLWLGDFPVVDFFSIPTHLLDNFLWHSTHTEAHAAYRQLIGVQELDFSLRQSDLLGQAGKFLWPLPDRGLRSRLYRVKAKTVVIWGHEDRLVPFRYATEFAKLIAAAELKIIKNCGHLPMFEQRELFVSGVIS